MLQNPGAGVCVDVPYLRCGGQGSLCGASIPIASTALSTQQPLSSMDHYTKKKTSVWHDQNDLSCYSDDT